MKNQPVNNYPPSYSSLSLNLHPPLYLSDPPSYLSLFLDPLFSNSFDWFTPTNHKLPSTVIKLLDAWTFRTSPSTPVQLTSAINKLLPKWTG